MSQLLLSIANCGPPPSGNGVSVAPSNQPYAMDPDSGILVANPGAVVDYTCVNQENADSFMGAPQLTCTMVDGQSAVWVPDVAPTCMITGMS